MAMFNSYVKLPEGIQLGYDETLNHESHELVITPRKISNLLCKKTSTDTL